jgi:hypothetical protein
VRKKELNQIMKAIPLIEMFTPTKDHPVLGLELPLDCFYLEIQMLPS